MFRSLMSKKKKEPVPEERSANPPPKETTPNSKVSSKTPKNGAKSSSLGSSFIGTKKSKTGSSGLNKKLLLHEVSKYGMSGQITAMGFDHTQSLLAVATSANEIHVYGKQQIEVEFSLNRSGASINHLRIVKGIYLVCVDSKDTIYVFSLHSKRLLATVFAPGKITSIESDPTLDWLLLGLENGVTVIYDLDRDFMSPIQIGNIQRSKFFTNHGISSVVSLQWNPRNIGQVLISYDKVTVIYSFVDGKYKQSFLYELPAGAPGGDGKISSAPRYPKVVQSLYHPNGLHILTVHEDNSLCFWDCNSGTLILARTLYDTEINQPIDMGMEGTEYAPIISVNWICAENSEYTWLLIGGGDMGTKSPTSLTLIDLGWTPKYSVTSYEKMAKFYSIRSNQKIFPMPLNRSVKKILPIPRSSPFFGGSHNPGVVLLLLDNGELETMLFPSGKITHKASLLPQSLSWIRPTASVSKGVSVPSKLWVGMMSSTYNKDSILHGGKSRKTQLRPYTTRSALLTGHTNGSVRIWDASHAELSETSVFDINISQVLNKAEASVDHLSFAPEVCELAVSCDGGEVVLFKFDSNKHFDPSGTKQMTTRFNRFSIIASTSLLVDVSDRAPASLKDGFVPSTAIHANAGNVTSLTNSNIGFVCVGYANGAILVVDRRGPAAILLDSISSYSKKSTHIVSCEFGISVYGDDNYSSIIMLCGTNAGEVLTFKILPEVSGRFSVNFYSSSQILDNSPVEEINFISNERNSSLTATINLMKELPTGSVIPGSVIVSGGTEIAMFTPGSNKRSSVKTLKSLIASSNVSSIYYTSSKGETKKVLLYIVLTVSAEIKVYSAVDLKLVKELHLDTPIQSKYIRDSTVLENGDIILRVNNSEAKLLSVVDNGDLTPRDDKTDTLYVQGVAIPSRPYYNTLQWARGDVYVYQADLDTLLGGGNQRPASKYPESEISNGTLSLKSSEDNPVHAHSYNAPVRRGTKSAYGYGHAISKAIENGYDTLETTVNDAATNAGQSLNESIEASGTQLAKGLFKSGFGL